MKNKFDVTVLGLGYIGLPTALILANNGNKVLGVDINTKLLEDISSKKIEKHLNFKFKKSIEDAIKDLKDAFIEKKLVDTFNDKKYFNIKILKDAKLVWE